MLTIIVSFFFPKHYFRQTKIFIKYVEKSIMKKKGLEKIK